MGLHLDEIDSLLRARQERENDAARRLQNEFFLQFDGVGSDPDDRILVMGATNRPHELDDAALRYNLSAIFVLLSQESDGCAVANLVRSFQQPLCPLMLGKLRTVSFPTEHLHTVFQCKMSSREAVNVKFQVFGLTQRVVEAPSLPI